MLPTNDATFLASVGDQQVVSLTEDRRRVIEGSTTFSVAEKINLIRLMMHRKWITEVGIGEVIEPYRQELENLGIPHRSMCYRSNSSQTEWLQAGINTAILNYVCDRGRNLSELEAGVLYGYPVSHSMGFAGILEPKRSTPDSVVLFYLAGTYSRPFRKEEADFFAREWELLRQVSPDIVFQADAEFAIFRSRAEFATHQPY